MKFPITPRSYRDLERLSAPGTAEAPEASRWTFYDTQTLTDNVTTQLNFFVNAQADKSLGNMQNGGQLPQPSFFEIFGITLDVFSTTAVGYVTTAAGGIDGVINDMGAILLTGRGRFTVNLSDKSYGPFPLSELHGTGGPIGGGWGTFTAEESLQYANNGVFDGGFWVGGSWIIPPSTNFSIVIDFPAALNLTGDYRLRVGMAGVLHRAVR